MLACLAVVAGGVAGAGVAGALDLTTTGLSKLTRELTDATAAAIPFQRQIAEIRTISQSSGASMDVWADSVRNLSNEFGRQREEVAEGIYQTLSNQVGDAAEATAFLSQGLGLARVTSASTSDAVNALSSAINSYRLDTGEAGDVAAKFFKAVEIGRFRLGELGTTFGRLSFSSQAVGVSLDEALAGLTLLTRQGLRSQEAMTLLVNIINQLLKPSEAMSGLFREWGVETGQLAIQAFGLDGVLQKVAQATKGNAAELARLFPELRAMRASFGLTGQAGQQFADDLQRIRESTDSYREAQEILNQTAGDKTTKAFNRLTNVLGEFGDVTLRTSVIGVEELNKRFDVGQGSIQGYIDQIQFGIGILESFRNAQAEVASQAALTPQQVRQEEEEGLNQRRISEETDLLAARTRALAQFVSERRKLSNEEQAIQLKAFQESQRLAKADFTIRLGNIRKLNNERRKAADGAIRDRERAEADLADATQRGLSELDKLQEGFAKKEIDRQKKIMRAREDAQAAAIQAALQSRLDELNKPEEPQRVRRVTSDDARRRIFGGPSEREQEIAQIRQLQSRFSPENLQVLREQSEGLRQRQADEDALARAQEKAKVEIESAQKSLEAARQREQTAIAVSKEAEAAASLVGQTRDLFKAITSINPNNFDSTLQAQQSFDETGLKLLDAIAPIDPAEAEAVRQQLSRLREGFLELVTTNEKNVQITSALSQLQQQEEAARNELIGATEAQISETNGLTDAYKALSAEVFKLADGLAGGDASDLSFDQTVRQLNARADDERFERTITAPVEIDLAVERQNRLRQEFGQGQQQGFRLPGNLIGASNPIQGFLSDALTDLIRGEFLGFADGGRVPAVRDRIPALLSPGEQVIRGPGARTFAPQLTAINNGLQPSQFGGNGQTISFGDILVTVEGGGRSTTQNAQQIGRAVETALRQQLSRR